MKIKCLGREYTIKNGNVTKSERIKQKKKHPVNFEKLLIFASGKDYNHFLKSSYWKNISKLIIKRDHHKCTKCGGKEYLQAHHLTYEHHFNEHNHLKDLVTLCKYCHSEIHKK